MLLKGAFYIGCTRKLDPQLVNEANGEGIIIDDKDVLSITLLDHPELSEQIANNTLPLVITSKHAADALADLIRKHEIRLKNKTTFCIDGRTAEAVKEAGLDIVETAHDSFHLAQKIAGTKKISHVLHAGANIRLEDWKISLQNQGIKVSTIEVYHKSIDPQYFTCTDGMLFLSPSQIDAFFSHQQLDPQTPVFCIGHTTATHINKRQHLNIQIAPHASAADLVQTVINYYHKK